MKLAREAWMFVRVRLSVEFLGSSRCLKRTLGLGFWFE